MESISAMASLSQSPKRAGPTDATAGRHDSRELTELVSKQVHMAHLSQERGGGRAGSPRVVFAGPHFYNEGWSSAGGSSSGRTTGSGPVSGGSNPPPPAITLVQWLLSDRKGSKLSLL